MKKLVIFFITGLLLLSLGACAPSKSAAYTVTRNGSDYIVDPENGTIFDGVNSYQYTFSGDSSAYEIDIIFPNGSRYWSATHDDGGAAGWSEDYDETRYVSGDILCDILLEEAPKESHPGMTALAFLLIGIGIFYVASPYTAWRLAYGWRYKGAEPSDSALVLNRMVGVVLILVGVIISFYLIFQ